MTPALSRPDPPFRQIASELRDSIHAGRLKPGENVPSVRAIVREYGVAIATAQRALTLLRSEGYIEPQPGRGNAVTHPSMWGHAASDNMLRTRKVGRVYPEGQHARIIETATDTADDDIAAALALEPGAQVIRRVRVRYSGDHPIATSTSWFDGALSSIAPRLLAPERITEGTFSYVARTTGRRATSWEDHYEPALASKVEAERLGIKPRSLITRGRNWMYDQHGDVIEYGESASTGRITYCGDITD
jgi:DNA-binding GntR family transcriptional regulator